MRLVSFVQNGSASYGTLSDAGVHRVSGDYAARYPNLRSVIAAQDLSAMAASCHGNALALDSVDLLPPLPDTGKILCAGLNYHKPYPVVGVAPPLPGNVVLFARHAETLLGHGAPLEIPHGEAAETFDYEGEIVVVIGKGGRHIAQTDAMDHVMGYSVMNEGSVRGWQKHSIHAGKNFAGSGSWGPWITTADDIANPATMILQTRLNGVLMQDTTADQMIFSVAEIISYISHLMPLSPGDIIATGSPDGTGGSRTPPRFLRQGDVVEVFVSDIGTLRNTVGD